MAQLSWGKPSIEFGKCGADGAAPTTWTKLPYDPVENSTKLTPTKGEKKEAKVEGGENEAVKYAKNTYVFEFEVRAALGRSKPIEDVDGVVAEEYAFRLTPENPECEGFLIERSTVSVEDTFDTAEGKKWKYTADVLKPKTGNQVKPYTAQQLPVDPSSLVFEKEADTTGKAIIVTTTGAVAAVSSESWATVAVASKTVTVKTSANTGALRAANISIMADGKTSVVTVYQAGV